MKRTLLNVLGLVACVGLAISASSASAEGFFDLYAGGAFTGTNTLDIETSADEFLVEADWRHSVTGGIRGGAWLGGAARFLGFALDVSYFRPKIERIDGVEVDDFAELHLTPVTPMVLVRLPLLPDDEVPGGRLQPYVGVGPGLFVSALSVDDLDGVDFGFDVGLDARAGATAMLSKDVGIFAEYRHTDVTIDIDAFGGHFKSNVETEHFSAGVTFRF